jgi:hypothetical protein
MWNPAAAYGDPVALDIDYIAGKSAGDLPDWLGTSHARPGPLIASAETLPRDVKGQAGSDQIAALHLRRNHAIGASRGGTVGAGNQQSERIADCEQDREKETEPGEKSKWLENSPQTLQGKPPAKRAETR